MADPCCISQLGFSAGLLLRLCQLVVTGVLHELHGSGIAALVPVLGSVKESRTLELVGVPVPVTQEDVLPIGGLDESQKSSKELRVGWHLDRFIGLEIDC